MGVTLARFDTPEGEVSVVWEDPWMREGPLWIEPVYLIGVASSIFASPPELQSTDRS